MRELGISFFGRCLPMSKKNSNPTVDAATAEKVSSLVDFCANKLMFGLVPKTFILTLFLLLLYLFSPPTKGGGGG